MKLPLCCLFLSVCAFTQQTQGALNDQRICDLVRAGVSLSEILRIIKTAPAVDFDLRPVSTDAMLELGVSEDVIRAMAARETGERVPFPQSRSALPDTQPASDERATVAPPPVDDIGVYYRRGSEWTELPPEVINWKTGGALKSVGTLGVIRGDINGRIRNGTSHTHMPETSTTEILVHAPEGTDVQEYQLLKLHSHPDSREFRTVTGGIFHLSGGADRDLIAFEPEPIAHRTWVLRLTLAPGEYGLLPPGAYAVRSASAQLGKMYTFSVRQ